MTDPTPTPAPKLPDDVVDFLRWLISMDDPGNPQGLEDRRTVTLTKIIDRARKLGLRRPARATSADSGTAALTSWHPGDPVHPQPPERGHCLNPKCGATWTPAGVEACPECGTEVGEPLCVLTEGNDMDAFAALPDCDHCGGMGKEIPEGFWGSEADDDDEDSDDRLAEYARNLSLNARLLLTGADLRIDAVTTDALRRGGLLDDVNELTEKGRRVVALLPIAGGEARRLAAETGHWVPSGGGGDRG